MIISNWVIDILMSRALKNPNAGTFIPSMIIGVIGVIMGLTMDTAQLKALYLIVGAFIIIRAFYNKYAPDYYQILNTNLLNSDNYMHLLNNTKTYEAILHILKKNKNIVYEKLDHPTIWNLIKIWTMKGSTWSSDGSTVKYFMATLKTKEMSHEQIIEILIDPSYQQS